MFALNSNEKMAINIIAAEAIRLQDQLNKTIDAQKALISLIETKYKTVYDEKTGRFNEVV